MFISANQLHREMGVDPAIARFFVDRVVPQDNSFWKGKLLYIGFGNGYLSIPVFYDLLHRLGISLDLLLAEGHIQFMEKLMHFAIEQERGKITVAEEHQAIRALLKNRIKNPDWYLSLCDYLDQPVLKPMHGFGTDQPSLNRADAFLYVLCDLPLKEKHWKLAVRYWCALHPTYLIMDDLRDYEKDKIQGEENVVLAWGDHEAGFQRAMDSIRQNCEVLSEINPRLGSFLLSYEEDLLEIIPKKG